MTPDDMALMMQTAITDYITAQRAEEKNKLFETIEYFTANQAAKILGITVETLRLKTQLGLIRKEKRNVTEKYHRDEIARYKLQRDDEHQSFKTSNA
jgi:hypothetical protein